MMNNNKLIIRRVIINSGSKVVYDENYHVGLNVIRGANGTGKSTIMELISYGLGGDIKKDYWKEEALECTRITLALKMSNKDYVLRRAIEGEASRPQIEIFEGTLEESLEKGPEWTSYKNAKSENRKSYSMQLFSLLGLEQHITADSDSLTLHQLLRILYIDQDTPASKIFRTEPFTYDKESMRKAIGEYAFGFDDLEAHSLRQKLYEATKKFEKVDDELKTIYKVLGATNIKATSKEIDAEIKVLLESLQTLDIARSAKSEDISPSETSEIESHSSVIKESIEQQALLISVIESEFTSVSYDISESLEFLQSLEYRRSSLQQAQVTHKDIGAVNFKYCPSCFCEITETEDEENCVLCKADCQKDLTNESYIQALNELDFQMSETKLMMSKQRTTRAELEASLKNHKETLQQLRINYNEINSFSSDFEQQIASYANQKGFIQAQIESLKERHSLASDLDQKRDYKNDLQSKINELDLSLRLIESRNNIRRKSVRNKISNKVIEILSEDGVENAFNNASSFEFDFATDSMRLNGRANFSASSNVILKNSFHLAALLVSVEDSQFRIPCFSMFDNIEDKGMQEKRSQNFQRIIAEECSELEGEFQLIMTTSMVVSDLNNDDFGVGPYYSVGEHTLNM
ncbi:AAA family ATPase [Paraglaciecola sp. MB-3u-78]|jgi:DNA repair exonuclease SbcCD ATPase subunit|uniref:AAA family ATPase n=1 Tax=Paraglaciecola sp. MB-3u-78 TaxID=2058332 RepID=UPI000C33E461|nr:AAA family ATPase [Paraglaciecola sp. MB-3u-78]PKG93316.1 hypothetical protein CXF95_27500 [Paraglaciecola sp. MB-3u-78]